jgi:ABC-2 type transport system ATP-binding protein
VIEVNHLEKSFGKTAAVGGLSFRAGAGEIFGLLGPNGAGKTTTIGCISGLLRPDAGTIQILGHDVVRDGPGARQHLGVVPQEIALYGDLSARENLAYWGGVLGMRDPELRDRIKQVLAMVGLHDRAKEPVKLFSGGMKRRLNFACGIIHEPKVLLLDEPTVGVDPQSRVHLLDMIRAEARGGGCILYTTHYMEEAETLCDRLAIVDHGKMLAQGTLNGLRSMLGERDVLRFNGAFELPSARQAVSKLEGVEVLQADAQSVSVSLADGPQRLPAVLFALASTGAEVRGATLVQRGLESLFIKLTGRELRG